MILGADSGFCAKKDIWSSLRPVKSCRITTPEGEKPIVTTPQYSTSYLKIVDIPISDPKAKDWIALLESSMVASPIGSALRDILAHVPHIMQCSPHSDSCIAWVNINDSVSGTSAKKFLGKFINISGETAVSPELNPAPVPSCAPGATDGAITTLSVAAKVYTVPYAGVLIARTLMLLWSLPPKLRCATA
jgi:hypothetical protein